jgi:hypothetical protein
MPCRVKAIPRRADDGGALGNNRPCHPRRHRPTLDYADYSNPIDQLPDRAAADQRHLDYDSLEAHSPNPSVNRQRYYQRNLGRPPVSYSPLMRPRLPGNNRPPSAANTGSGGSRNRNSGYRPRLYADHIRERQQPQRLRSFHSDPRLSVEEESLNAAPRVQPADGAPRPRDARPLSMFVSNY